MNGDALRLVRIMNNIKSKDLADQLGISSSYLSQIENDKRKPTLEILEKYAEIFHMKTSTLVFLIEEYESISLSEKVKGNTQTLVLKLMHALNRFGGYEHEE